MSDALATAQQRADALAAARPVLPYRSIARNHLAVVTVDVDGGSVVINGRPHSPAAALELSAAIARAVTELAGVSPSLDGPMVEVIRCLDCGRTEAEHPQRDCRRCAAGSIDIISPADPAYRANARDRERQADRG